MPGPIPPDPTEPVLGALVPEYVLTTSELRRQQRERLLRNIEDGCVSMADCLLESACPPAICLAMVGMVVHGFATLLLFTKQLEEREAFATCVSAHVVVQGTQLVMLVVAAILGNHTLTLLIVGQSNHVVQPRRIFLLAVTFCIEGVVVLPLVAPIISPRTPAVTPAWCHIDQPLPDGADRHVHIVRLLAQIAFAQCAYLMGTAACIGWLFLLGLTLRDPLRLMLPLGSIVLLSSTAYTFYYLQFARNAENALATHIALVDRCTAVTFARLSDLVTGDGSEDSLVGGLYGPRVRWTLGEPADCGTLRLHGFWLSACVTCLLCGCILIF